jgi:hypothetical protein
VIRRLNFNSFWSNSRGLGRIWEEHVYITSPKLSVQISMIYDDVTLA